jgi:hypothetical protein
LRPQAALGNSSIVVVRGIYTIDDERVDVEIEPQRRVEALNRRHGTRLRPALGVVDVDPAGDHTLYIGEVEHFECRDGRPLLFHAGKYGRLPLDNS